MDVNQIIEEIEDLLDDASTVPFSKKVLVDADDVLHLLQQIRQGLTFNNMISEHEVTKSANKYAEDIVTKAEKNALILKNESLTYVDELLATTQDKLKDILSDLDEDRKELKQE